MTSGKRDEETRDLWSRWRMRGENSRRSVAMEKAEVPKVGKVGAVTVRRASRHGFQRNQRP